jgi:hypothetical protein
MPSDSISPDRPGTSRSDDRRSLTAAPERHRTLAEVCDLYFPGVSPCALRWMIKRRGFAHSRWGREYRLTDSQVVMIQAELAAPARQVAGRATTRATARSSREGRGHPRPRSPAPSGCTLSPAARHRKTGSHPDPKQALAERLSAPLSPPADSDP